MKTLDEVIIALEVCTSGYCSHPKHGDCPYLDERNDCDTRQRKLDALHYLKAYRDDRNDLTALRAYWKEQHENNALTWEELKQMEGKPVWVEGDGWKVIRSFGNWEDVHQEIINFTDGERSCRSVLEHGDWQAYRKERS